MKKFVRKLLACTLLFAFPATVLAASNTVNPSEEGQAMIAPPSSSTDNKPSEESISPAPLQAPSRENTDNSAEKDEAASPTDKASSGVDWGEANTAGSPASGEGEFTIVIDPGHQGPSIDMSAPEPMAPGSSQTKPKATSGTQGNFSGVPEYEVNLQVSLLLQEELTARGYKVVMTRTDNETAISNKERAELATQAGADITVRIHCNSDGSSSAAGALTMSPTSANQYLSADVIEKSGTLSSCIINHYCAATGFGNRGILSADSMTGTNWSTVPVTILEMGFMSNQNDDLYLTDPANYPTMVSGIADGIDEYFSIVSPESAAQGSHLSDLTEKLTTSFTDPLEKAGESWAVAVMDPATDDYSTIRADHAMEAAGLIKTFIMGAVFENLVYKDSAETPAADYETTLKPLLTKMIAENDNLSADELVTLLGGEDFAAGVQAVNQFCMDYGFSCTEMGEEPLAVNSTVSNFTSAADCCRILTEIYQGNLVNEKASAEMLSLLKLQNTKDKIPSGLPAGTETANMTGYMTADQNPVLVENDAAIVLHSQKPYVICILTSNLKDNAGAKENIKKLSADVYQYMTESK